MLLFNTQIDLKAHLKAIEKTTLGFVPTMGALHKGHLSLMRESVANNSITVVSIFVNPTQFNNPEDLEHYPRTLEDDINKIKTVSEDIIIYAPSVDDIYQGEITSEHYDFGGIENRLEGKFRPGHFDGVGTIVNRLFEIVRPTSAYFGEKDFQQLLIIRRLVNILGVPVRIVGCPIYREENGLAMSSRNERLTFAERSKAATIFHALKIAKEMFAKKNSAALISKQINQIFDNNPKFDLEYFEIVEENTLLPTSRRLKGTKYRAFIAVYVNKIRLIDTIALY